MLLFSCCCSFNKIVTDSVCVMQSSSQNCVMQDVLFVGTGKFLYTSVHSSILYHALVYLDALLISFFFNLQPVAKFSKSFLLLKIAIIMWQI